jgi:HemY protein
MWIADGVASERWAPVSPVTGHLDAFVWKAPTELLEGPSGNDVTGDLDDRDDRGQPALVTSSPATEMPAPVTAPAAAPAKPAEPAVVNGAAMVSAPSAPATGPMATGAATPVVFPPPKASDSAPESKARLVG